MQQFDYNNGIGCFCVVHAEMLSSMGQSQLRGSSVREVVKRRSEPEAEDSDTRKCLVKSLQAGEDLACNDL
jgi:hypothetical protein